MMYAYIHSVDCISYIISLSILTLVALDDVLLFALLQQTEIKIERTNELDDALAHKKSTDYHRSH